MNKLAVSTTHLSSLAMSWQGLGGTLLLSPYSPGTLFGSPLSPGIPGLLVLTLLGPYGSLILRLGIDLSALCRHMVCYSGTLRVGTPAKWDGS